MQVFNKPKFKKILKDKELTIGSFCEEAGISPSTITANTGVMRNDTVDKIRAALESYEISSRQIGSIFKGGSGGSRARSTVGEKIQSLKGMGFNSDQILLVLEQE